MWPAVSDESSEPDITSFHWSQPVVQVWRCNACKKYGHSQLLNIDEIQTFRLVAKTIYNPEIAINKAEYFPNSVVILLYLIS
jgi:hypothetical protein